MNPLSRDERKLPPEQQAIIDKCFHPVGEFAEFRKEEIEQSVAGRFEQQVREYPDRLSVKSGNRQLTYDELNRAANRVAHAIIAACGRNTGPVSLLLEHGIPVITGFIGVLKARRACVPLDPSYPGSLVTYMLQDSESRLIVTNNRNVVLARKLAQGTCSIINIDNIDVDTSEEDPGLFIPPNHYSAIYYTSGSTGRAKGVIQRHRDLLYRTMAYTNAVHICKEDRLTGFQSFSFRASEVNFFGALLNGGAFFPYDLRGGGSHNLGRWLNQEEITIYYAIATSFRHFAANLGGDERFPHIRLVKIGGETVLKGDVELYRRHFPPDCIFLNNYAPTETGSARWYFINRETQVGDGTVPIGYPVEETEALILDETGDELSANEVGEIAIRGRYLSLGYWRKPEATNEVFLPGPDGGDERIYLTGDLGRKDSDGCLDHLGRKDFQVKIRGYRIEVSEIEMALTELESIEEAVVMGQPDSRGEQRLVAYIVPSGQVAPSASEILEHLAQQLPRHMFPSVVVRMEEFPLSPNGKVNRKELPLPGTGRPDLENPLVVPRTPIEEALSAIWLEVLNLDEIGIHDNFLELGGDSLLGSQVISRVINHFRVEIPLKDLFDSPTIAEMALLIVQHPEVDPDF